MNKELLEFLRENSRSRLSIFARKQKKPVTTIHFNYQKLLKETIIKNTSLLNFEKLGLKRFILIAECEPEEIENTGAKINNIQRTNKGILAEIIINNEEEKENTLIKLSQKRIKYSNHPVFEVIKQEEKKI